MDEEITTSHNGKFANKREMQSVHAWDNAKSVPLVGMTRTNELQVTYT